MPLLNITIANSQIPLVQTPNDRFAETLSDVLRVFGHRVTRLRLPLPPALDRLPQMLGTTRLINLAACDGKLGDRLIALDVPSACLRHSNKVLWISDPLGGLIPPSSEHVDSWSGLSPALIDALRRAARLFLCESNYRLATSNLAAARMRQLVDMEPWTLRPPLSGNLPKTAPKRDREPASEKQLILLVPAETGRLPIQRICDVMIRTQGKLAFIGYDRPGYDDPDQSASRELLRTAEGMGFDLQWLDPTEPEAALLEEVSGIWVSGIEEYSPWPAWRALSQHRPVVTTFDSGASADLIRDAGAGLVVRPDPDFLAATMVSDLPKLADVNAKAAEEFLMSSYPLWQDVVAELLEEPG